MDRIYKSSSRRLGKASLMNLKDMAFYKDFGVAAQSLPLAHDGVHIVPVTKIAHVHLDDLGLRGSKEKSSLTIQKPLWRPSWQTTVFSLEMQNRKIHEYQRNSERIL